eukprot:1342040-Prymnesium_polylepis.1
MDAMPQAYGEEGAEGADGMGEDAPAPISSLQSCGCVADTSHVCSAVGRRISMDIHGYKCVDING